MSKKDFSNLQNFNDQMAQAAESVLGYAPAPVQQPQEIAPIAEADQNKKSKRFNFMVKPAVYEELKSKAENLNISIGSLLNLIITDYLKNQKEQ